ncbi:hypothetical protein [Azohydromonas aeria]|uniref:hypothetical protein n=1 Tax=Azohydromonas aeria TaxID=2590212 RepID=UPI0012FAA9DA|nr:hypothetical protein [Azohydromonas aeria]
MKELDSNLAGALEALARAVDGCADVATAAASDVPAVLLQAARTLESQDERIAGMRQRLALLNQGFSNERIIGIYDALKPGSGGEPREEILAFARALFAAQASQGL